MSDQNPIWVEFARAMVPMMMPSAQAIADLLGVASAGPLRVLDIAAGHGIFGITIAQRNPAAEITAVDWAPVLAVATENAGAMGVAARHHTLRRAAPSPWTTDRLRRGADDELSASLRSAHQCRRCSRRRPPRSSPTAASRSSRWCRTRIACRRRSRRFAVTMLAGTPAGDAFTVKELDAMLTKAGFGDVTAHPLPGPQSVILARRLR